MRTERQITLPKIGLIYPLLMLIGAASYGLTPTFLKLAYSEGFKVSNLMSAQFGFATLILWLLTFLDWRRQQFPRQHWPKLIGIGVSVALTSYSYYLALAVLPASIAIVLLFQFAWIVMVIDIVVKKKLPSAGKWIGLIVIFIGTILAVGLTGLSLGNFPPLKSIGLGLLSAVFYALTLFWSGSVGTGSTPLARSAITISIAILVLSPFYPPDYLFTGVLWNGLWKWVILLALSSQVIPLLLMHKSIPHIGGRMAGVLGTIELPVTLLSASIFLSESVSLMQWAGALLIISGILISELFGNKEKAPAEVNGEGRGAE